MRSKDAVRTKARPVRSLSTGRLEQTSNVIDFMPYLARKQRDAARHATFLTLFMIFLSIFIIVV
ncbi:hypothetical protein [Alicyclobacillus mengziensis]|uniref:Uncharacterized protein n=1 Tax=Alicyclobacillus mengziensis TaxID=2931921 RepID=A0A9X7VXP4_9BACL|nr:hypothetical protein [Alicyclobacillus mengziensis]QSO46392.1 hypothetical protein JZ786_18180 [Alicyclobacillus mengziensis]